VSTASYWIIDADAHITESPDVWLDRVPSKWHERVPQIVRDPVTGEDVWYINGAASTASVGATAVAGAGTEFPVRPRNLDEVPLGAWQAKARLEYMDSVGIWSQVLYPNVGGFGNAAFLTMPDAELRLACVRAYNDWLLEWCAEDARRLIPVMATPFWDIDAAVREVQRGVESGHKGVLFTGEPQRFGMPYFGDRQWDPFWATVQECGVPISLHLGSGDMEVHTRTDRYIAHGASATAANATVSLFLENAIQLSDLLLSGVLPRFPELRFVSVESGAGWVPFLLEAVDYSFSNFNVQRSMTQYDAPPSEYFRRQISVCYFYEQFAPQRLLDDIGVANMLFETDYPHSVSLYGNVRDTLERGLAGRSETELRQVTWGNAASLYGIAAPDLDCSPPGH
jgi:uncharacterized protein